MPVECRVVEAERAYRWAQWAADDARDLFRETGFRRHRTARTEAIQALEKAAAARWDAWQAWRLADGDVAAVAHRRLAEAECDDTADA